MYYKKVYILIVLFTISCSDVQQAKYKDTEYLEVPPEIKMTKKTPVVVEDDVKDEIDEDEPADKGLGKNILLVGTEKKPVIKIKKKFDRSWELVDQALKLEEIEITDKDREQGVFYVSYDPDNQHPADSSLIDKMTFFFFKDEYEEASYKLTVLKQENETEVTVEQIESDTNDLLDDGEDNDMAGIIDDGSMLLNTLYKTLREDLPVD
ncbi:MAG: outer membrane protein assembly factor BamC [Methylococcaceae bacterium]|nr:outer membrane protein assembly factor BamC [Methylococcaceae bacterium]